MVDDARQSHFENILDDVCEELQRVSDVDKNYSHDQAKAAEIRKNLQRFREIHSEYVQSLLDRISDLESPIMRS